MIADSLISITFPLAEPESSLNDIVGSAANAFVATAVEATAEIANVAQSAFNEFFIVLVSFQIFIYFYFMSAVSLNTAD